MCFGPALAQEPQEVAPTALESQPETEGGQATSRNETADQGQKSDPAPEKLSPSLNKIEAAIRDLVAQERAAQGQAPKDEEIRDLEAQEGMALWAKAMFWATVAAVIITFAGIILIWRTLHHTRRAANYAKDMVEESRKATLAAIRSAETAQEAVEAARFSDRAWITMIGTETLHITNAILYGENVAEAVGIKIRIQNTGRTPALKVHSISAHKVIEPAEPTPHFIYKSETSDDVLGPGVSVTLIPSIFKRETIDAVDRRQVKAFVFCNIYYRDIFFPDVERQTTFCGEIVVEGTKQDDSGDPIPNIRIQSIGDQNIAT